MRKLKSLLLVICMLAVSILPVVGLVACNSGVDIAFCMSQSNELNEAIEKALQDAFPEQKVRSENANSNSTT